MLQYQIVQFILGANLNLLVIEETCMFRNVFVYLGANKLFYNSLHGRHPYKFGMIFIDPFGYTPIQPDTKSKQVTAFHFGSRIDFNNTMFWQKTL